MKIAKGRPFGKRETNNKVNFENKGKLPGNDLEASDMSQYIVYWCIGTSQGVYIYNNMLISHIQILDGIYSLRKLYIP